MKLVVYLVIIFTVSGCTKSFLDNFDKSISTSPEQSLPSKPNYYFKKIDTNSAKNLYKFPTAVLNNKVYFIGEDEEHGRELWVMNKDTTSRQLVKDIFEGDRGSEIFKIDVVGGRLYFWALHLDYGLELWTSDGTSEGTILLHETYAGKRTFAWRNFVRDFEIVEYNGKAYFNSKDDDHGLELWETDGTPAGTRRLTDLVAGFGDSSPSSLIVYQNKLYFIANSDSYGKEVFYYDSNTENIQNLTNVDGGVGNSFGTTSKLLKLSSYLLITYPIAITENLIIYDNTTLTNYSVNPSRIVIIGSNAYYSDDLGNGLEFIVMSAGSIGVGIEVHNLDGDPSNSCPSNFQQLTSGEIVFGWSTGCSTIPSYISVSDGAAVTQVFDVAAASHFQPLFEVLNNSIIYDSQVKENYIFEMSGNSISNTIDLSDTLIGPSYDNNYLIYQDTITRQMYLYNASAKTITAIPSDNFFTKTTVDEVVPVKSGLMYFDIDYTDHDVFHISNGSRNEFTFPGWHVLTQAAAIAETDTYYYIVMSDGTGNYKLTRTTKVSYNLTSLDSNTSTSQMFIRAVNGDQLVYMANFGSGSHFYCYDESTDTSTNISLPAGWNTLVYIIKPLNDGYIIYTGTTTSNRDPFFFTCDNSTNIQLLDDKTNGSSNIQNFIVDEVNGLAYFAAQDDAGDYNVYVTDGTVVGTTTVPGNLSYTAVSDIYLYQGDLYVCGNRFDSYDLLGNREEIYDHVGAGHSGCSNIIGDLESGKLVNNVFTSPGKGELYIYDVNTQNYEQITSVYSTKYGGYGIYFAKIYNNQIFYVINQGDFGGELWSVADDSSHTQTFRLRSYLSTSSMPLLYGFSQMYVPLQTIHGDVLLLEPKE